MKKRLLLVCCVLCMVLGLCACGDKKSSDAAITSTWKVTEITTNGETRRAEDFTSDAKDILPAITCNDESSCVFSVNGKSHNGKLEKISDNHYTIIYDDTDVTMDAQINGKVLTVESSNGTVKVVFETE